MSASHPRPWHRDSRFDAGPRVPLDRNERARFRFLVSVHRRGRRLTPLAELVGAALLKRLSIDGRCDPGHECLARDVGCCARTVRRALDALRRLGLLSWQRRLVRAVCGALWRCAQTSNAYVLAAADAPRCGGQNGRPTPKKAFPKSSGGPSEGSDAWAQWNAARQIAILLGKG